MKVGETRRFTSHGERFEVTYIGRDDSDPMWPFRVFCQNVTWVDWQKGHEFLTEAKWFEVRKLPVPE